MLMRVAGLIMVLNVACSSSVQAESKLSVAAQTVAGHAHGVAGSHGDKLGDVLDWMAQTSYDGSRNVNDWLDWCVKNGYQNLQLRCPDFKTWWDAGGYHPITRDRFPRHGLVTGWWNSNDCTAAHDSGLPQKGIRHVIGSAWKALKQAPSWPFYDEASGDNGTTPDCQECIDALFYCAFCNPDMCTHCHVQ